MKFIKALTLSLGELNTPLVLEYHLGVILHTLYKDKTYHGTRLSVTRQFATNNELNRYVNTLVEQGILQPYKGLPNNIYSILGKTVDSAEDIACTINPFAYVSHLSAMYHYGLTNRIPTTLLISSPAPKQWKVYAEQRMEKELAGDLSIYKSNKLPLLRPLRLEKIGKQHIRQINAKHLGAFKNVRGRSMRVSTMGRTFLDMLRHPEHCGGINHVIDVFDQYAETYIRLITDELEQHGRPIDKVRAGYLLDERVGIDNPIVDSWQQYAQRGGSRKLDASEEYMPNWSDKWCLSLNVFE